jgi:hypothetical protein
MFSDETGNTLVSLWVHHYTYHDTVYMFFCVSFPLSLHPKLSLCFFIFNQVEGIEYISLRPQSIRPAMV